MALFSNATLLHYPALFVIAWKDFFRGLALLLDQKNKTQ